MKKDKCLLDLPVLPYDRDSFSDDIGETYSKDVSDIKSAQDLKNHIEKWRNLWLLRSPKFDDIDTWSQLQPDELKLLNFDFDFNEVCSFLERKDEDGLPFENENVRIMANIVCPKSLLQATILADKYGVCTDLAMVRLYLDPYPEYIEYCRGGCGDLRKETISKVMET